jgi:hypothetical protein
MADEVMNLSDAADYLGITLVTLRKRIADGTLKVHSDVIDSRQKLVKRSDLDVILVSRGVNPKDAAQTLEQKRAARKEARKKETPVATFSSTGAFTAGAITALPAAL